MILVIRISGMVDVPPKVKEGLNRLRLRRKYSAILLRPTQENLKLLIRLRSYVAYGDIDTETLHLLIEKRAVSKPNAKKPSTDKIIGQLEKSSNNLDIKPFFRLHPPRGGIDSKKHFGVSKNAVLGDNKKNINALVRRML